MTKQEKKVYNKAYRLANPSKFKDYYEANTQKCNASSKAYRLANPEKVKGNHKAWRDANPQKIKAYYEANIEKVKAYQKALYKAKTEAYKASLTKTMENGNDGADWSRDSLIQEIERRKQLIISEPNGIVRETMIDNLLVDLQ